MLKCNPGLPDLFGGVLLLVSAPWEPVSGAASLADTIGPVPPRQQGLLGSGMAESCHRGSHHFAATKVHSIGFFFSFNCLAAQYSQ